MNLSIRSLRRPAWGALSVLSITICVGTALAGESGNRVTTVVGEAVTGGGRPLADRSEVADDAKLALGSDSNCSILIADDALVEVCEETRLALERDHETGRRRIRLDAGEIRMVVQPRLGEERIEIHTPAAVATILGTIVHVAVEPGTGKTRVATVKGTVRVESSDPEVAGSTTVSAREQISLAPGEAPPSAPRELTPEEIAALGGCLVDFHALARRRDGEQLLLDALEHIALSDGAAAAAWGGGEVPEALERSAADDLVDPAEVCSPALCPEPDLGRRSVRGNFAVGF